MIVTCVTVSVKSENIGDFIEASRKNHEGSIKEPGNMRFDVLQSKDDPSRFLLYEAYENEESAAAHKRTEHYSPGARRSSRGCKNPARACRISGLHHEVRSCLEIRVLEVALRLWPCKARWGQK
ncbi:MAG: Quinol monooxygenase YgiN, partial [Candidatus Kentron sp. G]